MTGEGVDYGVLSVHYVNQPLGGAGIRRVTSRWPSSRFPTPTSQTKTTTQGINPGSLSLWRCRESNPGPFRPDPVFYVRSRAVATRPPRFVRHVAVAAQSLW